MTPFTSFMLLHSALLRKKKACAPGGHKRFMLGGRQNRSGGALQIPARDN